VFFSKLMNPSDHLSLLSVFSVSRGRL